MFSKQFWLGIVVAVVTFLLIGASAPQAKSESVASVTNQTPVFIESATYLWEINSFLQSMAELSGDTYAGECEKTTIYKVGKMCSVAIGWERSTNTSRLTYPNVYSIACASTDGTYMAVLVFETLNEYVLIGVPLNYAGREDDPICTK